MNDRVSNERTPISQLRSRLSDFRATSLPLADLPPVTSDGREGQIKWSVYGNAGSQQILSAGPFAERSTDFTGLEQSSGSGDIAVSRCTFSEEVQYFDAKGSITFPNGTIQKVVGQIVLMLNALEIWSGRMFGQDKLASAQYYVTQTIRRQRIGNTKFHLVFLPPQLAYKDQPVGDHILRVYNDSTGALLQQQDILYNADPQSNLHGIFEISELVGANDFLRVEVIAQIALQNPNSPVTPVAGGSYSGAGFLDNAA